MNGNSVQTEVSDVEKIAFLIKSNPEFEALVRSEEFLAAWKKDFLTCIFSNTDLTLLDYKKNIDAFFHMTMTKARVTASGISSLTSLRQFISEIFNRLLKIEGSSEYSSESTPLTALLYNASGTILFSGIKKLPGKLELPSDLQEFTILDPHIKTAAPRLAQACPTAFPSLPTYPTCMRTAYAAKSLYYGVYSSFAPSFDSSYANINLGDGYDSKDLSRDNIDYELLEHEGIDFNSLLEDSEKHEASIELFSGLTQVSPQQISKPDIVSPIIPVQDSNSKRAADVSDILHENSKRLQKLKLSQKVRLRYRDPQVSVSELETAKEFLLSSTQLASLLPPSKLMSERGALRAINRWPFKETVFKGTLSAYQPYPTPANIWPNNSQNN